MIETKKKKSEFQQEEDCKIMLYVTWKMDVLASAHAGYKESFSLIRYNRPSSGVHGENDLQMPIFM